MTTALATPLSAAPTSRVTLPQSCPSCGLVLPLPRRPLAARVRCPEMGCGARLKVRSGQVSVD